ncbi:MAG: VOC family protein [Actinomycetota bacterium]|nr:VOC family protein [Actinomycetota bacterium]
MSDLRQNVRGERVTTFREPFPILYVNDVARAADFYASTFGFDVAYRWPAEGALEFAFLRLEPLGIGIAARHGAAHNRGSDFELCIYTDDVDAAAERLRAAGAEEVTAPADQPWGERLTYFRDADGHLLHVTAPL